MYLYICINIHVYKNKYKHVYIYMNMYIYIYIYVHTYIHMYIYIRICIYVCISQLVVAARPYESCKNLRAGPPQVPLRSWYKCGTKHFCLTDFCQAEMKTPTRLCDKTSTA